MEFIAIYVRADHRYAREEIITAADIPDAATLAVQRAAEDEFVAAVKQEDQAGNTYGDVDV